MRDTVTLFRKELQEVTGDRHSFRGALVQAAITIGITGILVPATDPNLWSTVTTPMMLFMVFPSTLAATMAADSFAGENERGTLETLLATPLSDGSIFLGKTAAAAAFSIVVAMASLAAAFTTELVRGLLPQHFAPISFLGIIGGAVAGAGLIAALVAIISLKLTVARSAQQVGSFLTFAFAFLTIFALRRLGVGLEWSTILWADAVVGFVALLGVFTGMRLFHRDRFFEKR